MAGYTKIRELSTQDLRNINLHVGALLSYKDVISSELRIKLDTLNADVTATLEDREDAEESGERRD